MGTLLVEGKTLFPRAGKKDKPLSASLMVDRILSLAAKSGIVASLAILEIDNAPVLRAKSGPRGLRSVLKTMAELLDKQTPDELLFDRWGAAGFLCLHPGATLTQTTGILKTLQELLYPGPSKLSPKEPITFSAGMAGFPHHGSTRIEILRRAEEALHVAQLASKGAIRLPPAEELREVRVTLSPIQMDRLSDLAQREATDVQNLLREAVDEFLRRAKLEERYT